MPFGMEVPLREAKVEMMMVQLAGGSAPVWTAAAVVVLLLLLLAMDEPAAVSMAVLSVVVL